MAVCSGQQPRAAYATQAASLLLFAGVVAANGQAQLNEVSKGLIGLGIGVGVLLAVAAYYSWRHYTNRQCQEAGSNSFKLRSQLVADSVAVAKKRNSKPPESSVAAALADIEKGAVSKAVTIHSDCGETANISIPTAERIPTVTFGLSDEDQKRLRATNINDSVVLIRKQRDKSTRAPDSHPAVGYYSQQLAQLGLGTGSGAEAAATGDVGQYLPGVPQADSGGVDGSSDRRVQFRISQAVAQEPVADMLESAAGSTAGAVAASRSDISSANNGSSGRGDDTARVEVSKMQFDKIE